MTKQLNRSCLLLSTVLLVLALCSACDILKLGPTIDKVKDESGQIGQNLAAGVVAGIDSSRLDSIVKRLTGVVGGALRNELDSVSFSKLEDSLNIAARRLLEDNLEVLNTFLADTSKYDQLEQKLQSMTRDLDLQVAKILRGIIPNALNDQNLQRIYGIRDSLLGPTTAQLIENALTQSVENLIKSEQLDSLIKKVTVVVDHTTDRVDNTTQGLRKTLTTVGIVLSVVLFALALLFFVLWFRKRSLARQQKELLLNMTKAIDAIPSRDDYDHTVAYLQKEIASDKNPDQEAILDEILQENKGQYPKKNKYKAYYERLVEQLKTADRDGSIRQQLLVSIDGDDDYKTFLENELNK